MMASMHSRTKKIYSYDELLGVHFTYKIIRNFPKYNKRMQAGGTTSQQTRRVSDLLQTESGPRESKWIPGVDALSLALVPAPPNPD